MKFHASQCDWQHDQCDHECNCGVTRPATVGWAETEVSAAQCAVASAAERLAAAEARLNDMTTGATT